MSSAAETPESATEALERGEIEARTDMVSRSRSLETAEKELIEAENDLKEAQAKVDEKRQRYASKRKAFDGAFAMYAMVYGQEVAEDGS